MAEAGPREAVLGSGAGGPLTAPTPWLTFPGYIQYVNGGVVIGTPVGGNKGAGSLNFQIGYVNGVLIDFSKYLPFTGGTLTGMLTLFNDPINPFDAATKKYVDSQIITVNGHFANYLPIAGGTLTGFLTLSADPTSPLQAVTKQYVDARFSGLIGIPDAPSDGTVYARRNATWVNAQLIDIGTY